MKLSFIEVAGFRGFRDPTRFDIPAGYVVISGRNGVGKSTMLDAVDFALTGTLSKFAVQTAKGGGLAEHIWWVGEGTPKEHYVRVGFESNDGQEFVIERDRSGEVSPPLRAILETLNVPAPQVEPAAEMLIRTTLIRDELISAMSLDLPGQARFAAVKDALGTLAGPDLTERTGNILKEVRQIFASATEEQVRLQTELGRSLNSITEARTLASRSTNVSSALEVLREEDPSFSPEQGTGAARNLLAKRIDRLARLNTISSTVELLAREWQFVRAPEFDESLTAYRRAKEEAAANLKAVTSRLRDAQDEDQRLRMLDEVTAHWASLIEHGETIGLVEGHCPLCDAARSSAEFESAIYKTKSRISEHYQTLKASSEKVTTLVRESESAQSALTTADASVISLEKRKSECEQTRERIRLSYEQDGITLDPADYASLQRLSLDEQQRISNLERAVVALDASTAVDRIVTAERHSAGIRLELERLAGRISAAELAVEVARQIDTAANSVPNEILKEQFDTVMPLLQELYRRLRPHIDWTEIDSDFGGKVRASLNFTVGEGRNPQFLFSSGQRRAAGLAFLLAIHLSRPWCKWRTLLLDDPVQHIDDYRALNLVEVLSSIRRTGRQILVAVEDSALADLLSRRLRSVAGEYGRRYELSCSSDGVSRVQEVLDIAPMRSNALRMAS